MNENTTPKSKLVIQEKSKLVNNDNQDNRHNDTQTSKPINPHTPEKPAWFHPDYPPFKSWDNIGKAVVEGQVFEYPQIVRVMADPIIPLQQYCLISFNLFKEPRMFREKPIYGFVKFRGAYPDDNKARFESYKIAREVDSKFFIGIGPTGTWLPITESTSVVKEIYDVKEHDEQKQLRTEAIKEKEADQKRMAAEIRDAEEALKNEGDIYDRPESLDFYAMKRVTEMRLKETIDAAQRKVDEYYDSLIKTHMILRMIEDNHPEYHDEWLECYNEKRLKTSLPPCIPGEKTFELYNKSNLNNMINEYPDLYDKVKQEMSTYGEGGKDVPKERRTQEYLKSLVGDKDKVNNCVTLKDEENTTNTTTTRAKKGYIRPKK